MPRRSLKPLSSTLLVLAVTRSPLPAQAGGTMTLTRLTQPITLDGLPDEPAWRDVPVLPLTLYTPVFRGTPSQRTEIRVAYDDDYLYAAGWFHDDDPGGIRINSLYRDRWNGDDAFAIYVDAFNDHQNSKWFGTTPGGIRFDELVSDDGNTLNANWDTFWTAKTVVTDSGWFAEVRIPFSSLGFRAGPDGRVVMGLTVTRLISRTGERVTFPAIDPKFEFRRPSVAQQVELHNVHTRTPLYVTPYVLTGRTRNRVSDALDAWRTDNKTSRDVGLDVRYPLSGSLTLDLTANTDFAQVEADDQQVNLDRFPLYYPERRRFFQEQSGIFDFTGGEGSRLFNSRRIGLADDGTPVPILGGARLVGRMGAWDVGLLDMQTDSHEAMPQANFGVLRVRRPVLNRYSTLGMMMTSFDQGDQRNVALGADGVLRVAGDDYLTLKWASTVDRADTSGVTLGSRSQFDARWDRRTGRGLQYSMAFTRSGPNYRPALGFTQRSDFTTANIFGNWFLFTDRNSYFSRVYPGALAFQTFRHSDGALESGQWAVWVEWDTKAGGGGWIEPKAFHENVSTPFVIGGKVDIPAGSYDFSDLQVVWSMPDGAKLRTTIDARAGTYFDGRRAQVIASPTWNVNPHLELGTDYQLTMLRFADRHQSANVQLARFRVRLAADARASGNAFIQYNSTTNRLDFNVRLRYAFAEGTDLWLVYNEDLDTQRDQPTSGLGAPLSLARALLLKYTHTFGF